MPFRPSRFVNQSQIFDGQSMRISDQLSNYDDTSPINEDQSKMFGNQQQTVNYSNANGNPSSPSVPVPVKVKDNILKVQTLYLHGLQLNC